jgi:hypothetical protein
LEIGPAEVRYKTANANAPFAVLPKNFGDVDVTVAHAYALWLRAHAIPSSIVSIVFHARFIRLTASSPSRCPASGVFEETGKLAVAHHKGERGALLRPTKAVMALEAMRFLALTERSLVEAARQALEPLAGA